jgi:hypothetical protein
MFSDLLPRRSRPNSCTAATRRGQDWADIIDFLTMHPEARLQVAMLLGEIGAT